MIDALELAEAKNAADCINLAQANHHHRAKTGKRIMEVNTANMRVAHATYGCLSFMHQAMACFHRTHFTEQTTNKPYT